MRESIRAAIQSERKKNRRNPLAMVLFCRSRGIRFAPRVFLGRVCVLARARVCAGERIVHGRAAEGETKRNEPITSRRVIRQDDGVCMSRGPTVNVRFSNSTHLCSIVSLIQNFVCRSPLWWPKSERVWRRNVFRQRERMLGPVRAFSVARRDTSDRL